MRERARVLDSRYLEFIEYLQKLGELQSIARMIARLCGQDEPAIKMSEKYGQEFLKKETISSRMMYLFWQKRWIEVREIEKRRDYGLMREYVITLNLKDIFDYVGDVKMEGSSGCGFTKGQNYSDGNFPNDSDHQCPEDETLIAA